MILSYVKLLTSLLSSLRIGGRKKTTIKQLEEQIIDQYVQEEMTKSRGNVIEGNNKVRWIIKNWMGLSTNDAFRGWRECVAASRKRKRMEQRAQMKEERLRFEDELARYEMERIEVSALLSGVACCNDTETNISLH